MRMLSPMSFPSSTSANVVSVLVTNSGELTFKAEDASLLANACRTSFAMQLNELRSRRFSSGLARASHREMLYQR